MTKTFTIEPVVGNTATSCKVYANGRQQCQIMVRVGMEKPLSEAEKASVKLAQLGTGTNYDSLTLPAGMVTSPQNDFDQHPDNTVSKSSPPESKNEADEILYFFLSCSSMQPSAALMAVIRLDDGQVYTTYYNDGSANFDSSMTVVPVEPFVVKAGDLHQVGTAGRSSSQLETYIWDLGSGLSIRTRELKDNGWETGTHNSFYHDGVKGGINEVTEAIASSKSSGTFSFPAGRSISYSCSPSQFAAAAGHVKDSSIGKDEATTEYDHNQEVRMLDNFGTSHPYNLRGSSSENGKIYIS
ncbi:MAG: hypothetical protein AAGC60_04535 [Acidobacteriota bacterium]